MSELLTSLVEGIEPAEAVKLLPSLLRLREKKRRADPLSFFRPNPGTDQERFWTSLARERWVIASNRWGKTEIGGAEGCARAQGRHSGQEVATVSTGWVVSKTYQMQRDVIQPKIRKYLSLDRIANITYRMGDVWDRIVLTCYHCGIKPRATGQKRKQDTESWWCARCDRPCSIIGFKSEDQGREKMQGVNLDWVWIDEEIEEDIYEELKYRLIDKKGVLWATMTPVKGMTWTFDRIKDVYEKERAEERRRAREENRLMRPPRDLEVFGGSMYDNPFLDPTEIERAERETPDPAKRRIRIYGEYQVLEGLIYGMWDPEYNEVAELPKGLLAEGGDTILQGLEVYCGIDTGKYFAATFWLCDYFGNLWGFAEHYSEGESLRSNAKAIRSICRQWDVWPTFILDGTSQFETDLSEEGIPCTKTFVPVDVGIQIMINYITSRGERSEQPRLYVVSGAMKRWLWERQRYQIEPPAKSGAQAGQPRSTPLKRHDHALDSSRYVVSYRPPPSELAMGGVDLPIEARIRQHVRSQLMEREQRRDRQEELDDI